VWDHVEKCNRAGQDTDSDIIGNMRFVWDHVVKCNRAGQDTDSDIIGNMRFAC
jgi:hypothetical protein